MEQNREKGQTGFSLIELIIAIAIMAILMKLSMPSYAAWVGNQQIRAGAESIIGAIQIARMEAMKQNGRVMFRLTDGADATSNWRICSVPIGGTDCDLARPDIQTRDSGDDSALARVGISTLGSSIVPGAATAALSVGGAPAGIIFDGRGRPSTLFGFVNIARIDVMHSTMPVADQRRLVITLLGAGSARMCDPQIPAAFPANPRACL